MQLAEAWNVEHSFDDDGAADQEGDDDAQQADGRQQRIPEDMAVEDDNVPTGPWSGRQSRSRRRSGRSRSARRLRVRIGATAMRDGERRQEQMPEIVEEGSAEARDRKQPQAQAEQDDEHQAEPEGGQRPAR